MDVFSVASRHVEWLQSRQQVLAENIANSDTPGFQAKDIATFKQSDRGFAIQLASTNHSHLGLDGSSLNAGTFEIVPVAGSDVTHSGNSVSLEREMKKVGETGLAFSFDTSISKVFHRMLMASVKG